MSLITNKQQELINQSISNFIKTYDKIAIQYLNLRKDIYQFSIDGLKCIKESTEIPANFQVKAHHLQFELDKLEEMHKIHLSNLSKILDARSTIPKPYVDNLKVQFDKLKNEKIALERETQNIRNVQKPLVDDMRILMKSFEANLSSRSARRLNKSTIKGIEQQAEDSSSKRVDLKTVIFTYDELRTIFRGIDLRYVTEEEHKVDDTSGQPINILRYLDDQLKNSRAFYNLGNGKYVYDITRSSLHGIDHSTTIVEYDRLINNLIQNIREILAQGAQAKERWSNNARKLETVSQALKDMDDSIDAQANKMDLR